MNPLEDEELDAMMAAAEVKEDYLDLGMAEGEDTLVPAPDSPSRGEKSGARRMLGVFSNGKKYRVKSVDEESNLCLSYIGTGATFCLRENCTINHGTAGDQAFVASEGGVLVILKNSQVAFAAPTLRTTSVEKDVVEDWEGQSFALEDWQQMFRASNQGEDFVMSFQDIKLEMDATRNVESFQTPAKKKKVSIIEPGFAFEGYSKVFGSPQLQSQFKRTANSASLAESIVGLDSAMGGLSIGVDRLFKGSVEAVKEVEIVADMGYRKATGLENILGSFHLMDDSEFAHPTLWGSLATMGAEISNLRNLKPPPLVDLGPFKKETKLAQDNLVASMTKISTFTRSFSKSLLSRIVGVEEETKRLLKKGTGIKSGDEFDSLLAEAAPDSRTTQRQFEFDHSRVLALETSLEQVLATNESLERRFAQIIAENEADAVKFAGLGLRGPSMKLRLGSKQIFQSELTV
jgi:hypothetical protein